MKNKTKNIVTRFIAVLLCSVLLSSTLLSTVVHAVAGDFLETLLWHDPFGNYTESFEYFLEYVLAQYGVITSGSYEDIIDNTTDYLDNVKSVWTPENVQIKTDSNGKKSVVLSKAVADALLDCLKEVNKKTDNGGYELVKTVPISRLSSLYFETPEQYATLLNLLNDNNGFIAYKGYRLGSNKSSYYKVDYSCLFVKGSPASYSFNGTLHKFDTVILYKKLNAGSQTHYAYILNDDSVAAKKWDDTDNLKYLGSNSNYNRASFCSYDYFKFLVDANNKSPLSNSAFLITKTGASIPVFNTIDDAVNYSVLGNLYYTTSDFTGEGKEITIDPDELDKILGGYYSGMYDMLQKLIEQNGGNSLTPDQLQELVDQVVKAIKDGLGDLGAETEETNNILLALRNTLGKGIDDIKEKLDEIIKQLKKIKNWTALGAVFEGLDFIMDLADFIKDFFDDVSVGVGFLSYGLKDVINLAKQKFPFSIPWDIAFLIAFLADTPETPVFEIPFELKSYGISEKIVIDFSHFSSISKISRMFLTMIYIVGLLNLTNKIIANKKGA